MNDKNPKSKVPDLDELKNMTLKLLGDVKKSVCEIYDDYQLRHGDEEAKSGEPPQEVKHPEEKAGEEKKED